MFVQQPILPLPLSFTAPASTSRCYSRHCGDTHTFAAPLTSSRSHARKRGDIHVIAALRTSSRRCGLHRSARHGTPKITSTQRDLRHHNTMTPEFPSADFAIAAPPVSLWHKFTPTKLQMDPKRLHSANFNFETYMPHTLTSMHRHISP